LNELDNGILIAFKLTDGKFLSKYINNKIDLLLGADMIDMTDTNAKNQQFFDSQVFTSVIEKKDLKSNHVYDLLSLG